MDIRPHRLLGNPRQPFNVGADVIHPQRPGIQHQEHVINVGGQLGEQLIPVQNLPVLGFQSLPIPPDGQRQQHSRKADGDSGRQHQRTGLQALHTGIDHSGGHHANHDPIVHPGSFINEVVIGFVHAQHSRAGAALSEILLQSGHFLIAQAGILLQRRQKIVDFPLGGGVLHHHPAVGTDDVALGFAVKGGDFQCLYHIGVIEANGNDLIGKAPEAARCRGRSQDHDLGPAGHNGVHDQILTSQNQLRQIIFEIQISGLPINGPVTALPGDKVEIRKAGFLLGVSKKRFNVRFIGHIPQVVRPQSQSAPVLLHEIGQRAVGLMEYLRQMRNTLCADGLRYKQIIPCADSDHSNQQNDCRDGCAEPFFHEIPPSGVWAVPIGTISAQRSLM